MKHCHGIGPVHRSICAVSHGIRMQSSLTLKPYFVAFTQSLLKPGVRSSMKMQLEHRRQVILQLHVSNQQFYCILRCDFYRRFYGNKNDLFYQQRWVKSALRWNMDHSIKPRKYVTWLLIHALPRRLILLNCRLSRDTGLALHET